MAAVANTSPLILLTKVNRLTLLSELYSEVFVPPAVAMDLLTVCSYVHIEPKWHGTRYV